MKKRTKMAVWKVLVAPAVLTREKSMTLRIQTVRARLTIMVASSSSRKKKSPRFLQPCRPAGSAAPQPARRRCREREARISRSWVICNRRGRQGHRGGVTVPATAEPLAATAPVPDEETLVPKGGGDKSDSPELIKVIHVCWSNRP